MAHISVDFRDGMTSADVEAAISDLEIDIKDSYPEATRIFIEVQSFSGHQASVNRQPKT
ncbi:MAG: hypothetical protein HQ483_01225 [Rhodospirillales bacterium]|nr:hypothetical protein [Rhodospirillales bacterium]